jgi:hypothetical protein
VGTHMITHFANRYLVQREFERMPSVRHFAPPVHSTLLTVLRCSRSKRRVPGAASGRANRTSAGEHCQTARDAAHARRFLVSGTPCCALRCDSRTAIRYPGCTRPEPYPSNRTNHGAKIVKQLERGESIYSCFDLLTAKVNKHHLPSRLSIAAGRMISRMQ